MSENTSFPIPLLEQNLNVLWASLIIQEFLKIGIKQFYVSPGNRNAPFLAALEKYKSSEVHIHLCMDERAAAYRALGFARGSNQWATLICTSGTAMANYYPAIIEAQKENLPLIVLSADRPFELQGSDANQTIPQQHFFGQFTIGHLYLPAPSEQVSPQILLRKLDYLLLVQMKLTPGPVHINCPFGDPLVPKPSAFSTNYLELARKCSLDSGPQTTHLAHQKVNENDEMPERLQILFRELSVQCRGLIIVGNLKLASSELKHVAQELHTVHRLLGMPIFLDVSSGLRGYFSPTDLLITSLEQKSTWDILKTYQVDTVIHLGGRVTAQKYYSNLLEYFQLKKYLLLSSTPEHQDPLGVVDLRWHTPILSGLKQIKNLLKVEEQTLCPEALGLVQSLAKQKQSTDKILNALPWSFSVLAKGLGQSILKHQQENIQEEGFLFIGNSLSIRVMDELSPEDFPALPIFANRGVSGIEGQVATAVGLLDSRAGFGVCLLGDVGLIHDLNSLLFLREWPNAHLCIVVVNNGGGRIFERLPMRGHPEVLTPYMTTPHALNFEALSSFSGLAYRQVLSAKELTLALEWALSLKKPVLIEATLDPVLDLKAYDKIQNQRPEE